MAARDFSDPEEAQQILAAKVEDLRRLGYDELKRRCGTVKWTLFEGRLEIMEGADPPSEDHVVGESGVVYYVQTVIEDPFGPVDVSVILGERYGNATEISDGFEVEPPSRS